MKRSFILTMAGLLLFSAASRASETAHARLYCVSLQFQRATVHDSYGFQWTMDLTTLSSGINGELSPYFLNAPYSHSAYLEIYSELFDENDSGAFTVDVPEVSDANGNGFPDFFEVSQGVTNLTANGEMYSDSFFSDTMFQATWNRAAGSATGTCTYQLPDPSNPFNSITFTHTFELLEYTGPLIYTPGSNTVAASINLSQTGDPANTLLGPVNFDKSTADHFNTLTNQPGVWTNAASQTLAFDGEIFSRDAAWPTNYYGYVYFTDGDPTTGDADYQLWMLSIDDASDADVDGIPDFSDDPDSVTPPLAPTLSLTPGQTNLWLTISDDIGHTNLIQETDSLTSTNWQTILSLTLTNNPQTVSLPLPAGQAGFWRALAQ